MSNNQGATSTRRLRILGLAAAAVAGLGTVAASGAPAVADIKDDDRPRVTANHIDFGVHWTVNAPRDGGYLDWDYEGGEVTPMLSGYLYLNDEWCGRVHMEYYDAGHDFIDDRDTATYCAPGNNKAQWWVEIDSFSHPDIDHVHVEVERYVNGGYSFKGQKEEDFD